MSTQAVPASNARWFIGRAPLANGLALAAVCFLASQPLHAQKRREVILRLRDDVATAMAHVSLEEKQTLKLDRCRQMLLLGSQSGGAQKNLSGAVNDIEKLFHKGLFLDEDRKAVEQDIHQLRIIERNQQARRNTRRYP